MNTDTECVDALRLSIRHSLTGQDFDHVCHQHLKRLGGHIGIRVKNFTSEGGIEKLVLLCWRHRSNLEALKINPEYANKFRLANRPQIPSYLLGIYKYPSQIESLLDTFDETQAKTLIDDIVGPGAWDAWHTNGNIIVKSLFDWVWEGVKMGDVVESGIGSLIDEEFDVYHHHQRQRNETTVGFGICIMGSYNN